MSLPKMNPENQNDVPQTGTKTDAADPTAARPHDVTPGQSPLNDSGIIPPGVRGKWIARLVECLDATRFVWDRPSGQFREEPDTVTRLKAVELAAAYDIGRPVERKVNLVGNFQNYDSKLEKLLATPEGMRVAIAAGLVEPLEKPAKTGRGTRQFSSSVSTGESAKSQVPENQEEAP